MRGSLRRDSGLAALIIVPLAVFIAVFVLLPTGIVIHSALTLDGHIGVDALRRTLTDAERAWFLQATLICAVSSVLGGLLGVLLAVAVAGLEGPRWLRRGLSAWSSGRSRVGGVPLAFVFVATIGVQGVLTRLLTAFGVPVRTDDATVGFWPSVLVYVYFLVPLMVLVVLPAAVSLPRTWREAAALLGCGPVRYWRIVGGPVLTPAVIGGVLLLFVSAFTAHATARVLDTSDRLLPERIRHVLQAGSAQDDLGLVTISWTIALLLCSLLLTTALQRRTLRMTSR